ncbi:hypothetical protein Salat_1090700 [Sesamum alatum]|uniref:Uncharacterized protein n=1 Tax=Sesamum alatum TaxID=300844 RepID=A0AAE1YNK9_9LAMI|nr:hypothetical protein Salat_1090700 [Sesamum alatum]
MPETEARRRLLDEHPPPHTGSLYSDYRRLPPKPHPAIQSVAQPSPAVSTLTCLGEIGPLMREGIGPKIEGRSGVELSLSGGSGLKSGCGLGLDCVVGLRAASGARLGGLCGLRSVFGLSLGCVFGLKWVIGLSLGKSNGLGSILELPELFCHGLDGST